MDVIELGVQSFDENVLRLSKRGHSKQAVYEACNLIKSYGFTLGIQLMIGLPGDSYSSCMNSVRETIAIAPQIARLYPTVVLPKTELCDMMDDGRYTPPGREEMLNTVVDMYKALVSAGINVIRIGLKSNELIKGDTYHPAFGQLVQSRIAREKIEAQLDGLGELPKSVAIMAPPELINFASGHKAENRKYFENKYPKVRFSFISSPFCDDYTVQI